MCFFIDFWWWFVGWLVVCIWAWAWAWAWLGLAGMGWLRARERSIFGFWKNEARGGSSGIERLVCGFGLEACEFFLLLIEALAFGLQKAKFGKVTVALAADARFA